MVRIITYNVNGIRSAMSKGFVNWLKATNPDIICLQEVKAEPSQIDMSIFENLGYEVYWYSAKKKGYSGVAIFTKLKPRLITYGSNMQVYDDEGRIIRADYDHFSVISVYHPSGTTGDERQAFKYKWLNYFHEYVTELKQVYPNLIICGDYNICHEPIDIHNPKSNAKSSGFLPEERAWIGSFMQSGFIDSFRHLNKEPHHYTWWSFRANARIKNLGWRIDYNLVSKPLEQKILRAAILPEAKHSDHCPVLLEMDL